MSIPTVSTPLSGSAVRLFELITSSWIAAAVSAAAELGVADVMSREPKPVEELAPRVGADVESLHRLLRACTDLDLVRESPERCFALTDLGEALREDSPSSMRGYARWLGSPTERTTMAHLADAVRSGGPVFQDVHGVPVWEYVRERPEVAALFDQGMSDISAQLTRSLAQDYDFGAGELLVDVGAGEGDSCPWCCRPTRICGVCSMTDPKWSRVSNRNSFGGSWPIAAVSRAAASWTRYRRGVTSTCSPASSTTGTTPRPPRSWRTVDGRCSLRVGSCSPRW